ncbi:hypothetical protein GGR54DRAFT_384127 [Hypoxylon sp. NC1633]|nr:hypothetical protein GGR54DRAFT_384127 [Hypoxylon sp. NC1633]
MPAIFMVFVLLSPTLIQPVYAAQTRSISSKYQWKREYWAQLIHSFTALLAILFILDGYDQLCALSDITNHTARNKPRGIPGKQVTPFVSYLEDAVRRLALMCSRWVHCIHTCAEAWL